MRLIGVLLEQDRAGLGIDQDRGRCRGLESSSFLTAGAATGAVAFGLGAVGAATAAPIARASAAATNHRGPLLIMALMLID